MKITFYSSNTLYKYICVFCYKQIKPDSSTHVEYLYDQSLPLWDYLEIKDRKKIKMISLGIGTYSFQYHECNFNVTIHRFTDPVCADQNGSITYELILECEDEKVLYDFVDEARETIQDEVNMLGKTNKNTIRKYMFEHDRHGGDWHVLNVCKKRQLETLFLEDGMMDKLKHDIDSFRHEDTKKEYEKYGIPYKYNILLHGLPGTGKTTTIHCIASMLNSDIGILQLTNDIDDITLTKAINSMTRLDNCNILVLEDIDSIFSDDRKAHDSRKNNITLSGLLNFLDGLMRNEGIIVFITTNNRDVLDDAVFRTGRIDLQFKYDYCTEAQVKKMIAFYFPDYLTELESFYSKIQHMELTVSDLQGYFFKHRKTPLAILKHVKEIVTSKDHKKNHLYT